MRLVAIPVALLTPAIAVAVPTLLDHQGRLTDSTGQPMQGQHDVTFRLYDSDVQASAFWSESQTLPFANGYYGAKIGNGLDVDSLDLAQVWLGIEIDSAGELQGRQRLTSVPYALRADTADRLRCPSDMADAGAFCIDIDENGQATWQDAAASCVAEGKRLCGMAEWMGACRNAPALGLNNMVNNNEYVDEYWVMHYSSDNNYYSAYVSLGNGNCGRVYYSGWACSNSSCYDTTHPGRSVGYYSRCCR